MQTRLLDFDLKKNTLGKLPSREKKFFTRDCLSFIQMNSKENPEQVQERLSQWVAERKRRYGIPLSHDELEQFNACLAEIYPHCNVIVKK